MLSCVWADVKRIKEVAAAEIRSDLFCQPPFPGYSISITVLYAMSVATGPDKRKLWLYGIANTVLKGYFAPIGTKTLFQ
jgi:hypothetical protein